MLDTDKKLTIQPSKVTLILGIIAALLVLANVAAQIVKLAERGVLLSRLYQYLSFEQVVKVINWLPTVTVNERLYLFDMGAEGNVPTYFSTVIILIAAFLLNTIAAFNKRNGRLYALHWRILAIIFVYLSVDEMVAIHEIASDRTQKIFSTSGPLNFPGWVIPGGVFVLIFALSYCRFLLHLPLRLKILFLIAGVLCVGGAIGFEIVGVTITAFMAHTT